MLFHGEASVLQPLGSDHPRGQVQQHPAPTTEPPPGQKRVCLLGSTVVHSEPRKDQGAEVSLSQALEGRPPWQPSSAAPRMLLNKTEDFLSITQDSYFCYHVSCLPQPKEGKWFSTCQLL